MHHGPQGMVYLVMQLMVGSSSLRRKEDSMVVVVVEAHETFGANQSRHALASWR